MSEHDGLLELAQAGKRAGIEGLFHAYSARVYSFARRMTDVQQAQDVTIEAFKAVYRELVTFTTAAGVLLKLFERAFADALHRAKPFSVAEPGWSEVEGEPDEDRIELAVEAVNPRERGIWLLKLEGFADAEIAHVVGLEIRNEEARAASASRVTESLSLAKRQFLATLSMTPAVDALKAEEKADELGIGLSRRPAPAQVWATIERAVRAERIMRDEGRDEAPRRKAMNVPWMMILAIGALALLVGAGVTLRLCDGGPRGMPGKSSSLHLVVGVHEGEAGVWALGPEGAWTAISTERFADDGEFEMVSQFESWRSWYRRKADEAAFDRRKFNETGKMLADWLRGRAGPASTVEFRGVAEAQ